MNKTEQLEKIIEKLREADALAIEITRTEEEESIQP